MTAVVTPGSASSRAAANLASVVGAVVARGLLPDVDERLPGRHAEPVGQAWIRRRREPCRERLGIGEQAAVLEERDVPRVREQVR